MILFPLFAVAQGVQPGFVGDNPPVRDGNIPRTRWEHRAEALLWTRSTLSALRAHGAPLVQLVPGDIANWCPAYPQADADRRRAFWVGFLSALAKHESTYRPDAVGGGGKWFGLLQIKPSTARGYKCRAGSGAALKNGPDNLSCAVRIMAVTVPRDGVVSRGMGGVAADWGPLHNRSKRNDMMAWTRAQSYCKPIESVRPQQRPAGLSETQDRN
ncbi:transglycosylase SLT domain-containing protein [Roseovarius litorisediminis]|nr:transglycosylase SLT domain-containing protein [Roseovarius litorisediminis]